MLIKRLYNHIILHRWDLAFITNSIDDILNGKKLTFQYVKNPYKNRWYADPFILSYDNDEIILLVEDYEDSDQLGKISKLKIVRNSFEIKEVKTILQLDSHLSFPAIIRKDGKVYIYPENSQADGLWLYEYSPETDECTLLTKLSEAPLTDAIITEYWGKKQIFSTEEPSPNRNILGIYDWNDENRDYRKSGTIKFRENIARNAGDFFEYEGNVYRPAQECNQMYGHAVSIQKIEKKEQLFKLTEVKRIMPPKGAFGIHTFNVYENLIVIDLKVFRHPWIAVPLFKLRNLLKR